MTSGEGYGDLMNDFLSVARLFEGRQPEVALTWLFPSELDDQQVHRRVHLLVAVGAMLTGLASRATAHDPPAAGGVAAVTEGPERALQVLTSALMEAGGRLDAGWIRDLIMAHCTGTGVDFLLVDVAMELLGRFVVLTGGPLPGRLHKQGAR